jgi:cytochrome c553
MHAVLVLLGLVASIDALADAKAGEKKAQLCLLCHRPGNVIVSAPLLEAQPSAYLVKAITEYKTGKRPDPAMKTNVGSLSSRDIKDIADYFASRAPITGVQVTDAAKVAAGEKRVSELKCSSCHGRSFGGTEAVPRLAGQTTGYLVNQMEAFAEGRRTHPTTETAFNKIAELEAIAHYLSATK